jgi:FkbH-like protein
MSMEWLPLPANFRADLRVAREESDPAVRLGQLAALAQCRLDFLQTIQLDQMIRRESFDGQPEFQPVRLALLASHTVDHLVPGITVGCLRRRLLARVHVAPYGQYRQALLEEDSFLFDYRPDFVLFSLSAAQVLPQVPPTADTAEAEALVAAIVAELRLLWRQARERLAATVLQQTFLDTAEPLFGGYDRVAPGAPTNLIARLNARVSEAAAEDNVLLLDVAREATRSGLDTWFDRTRWLQGKLEISPPMGPMYGELVARLVGAQRGLSRKCLVLDLDNTLWGGVVGDVGVEGIVLGEGTGVGEAYLAVQRYAKMLKDRGIILAVCSRNDPQIAEAAFREHPEMILGQSDIAVFVANWQDKVTNMLDIAERLNIGVDSLVFLDDNPAERARVRESLPTVAVPELPDDAAGYVRCLADAGYFEAIAFTSEDAQRARQYSANTSREALRSVAATLDDFLQGLEMRATYGAFRPVDLQRVAQLVNKTNQFNPTTKRYSLQEITAIAAADQNLTLQFRLVDRFGDNGLVSSMILRPAKGEPAALDLDTWVMSCRVFGRQLEDEAMNVAVETARARGVKTFRAIYIPTARNGVVKDLYARLGFAPVHGAAAAEGATEWRLDLDKYVSRKTSISRQPDFVDGSVRP